MTPPPLILLTNDDGIDSPGLHAVMEAVADLGELLVVAPISQQTAAGRSYPIALSKAIYEIEIRHNGQRYPAYKVDASPAQSVTLAVRELAPRPIALCISGINYGENLGSGVTISGTVGAAIDAACFGIPALAMSLETPREYHLSHSSEIDFATAAHFTRQFAQQTLSKGHPAGVDLLKIDIPAEATPQTPWRTASVSRQRYYDLIHNLNDGSKAVGGEAKSLRDTVEPGSDVYTVLIDKQVAVAPMTFDMTAPTPLAEVGRFLNGG